MTASASPVPLVVMIATGAILIYLMIRKELVKFRCIERVDALYAQRGEQWKLRQQLHFRPRLLLKSPNFLEDGDSEEMKAAKKALLRALEDESRVLIQAMIVAIIGTAMAFLSGVLSDFLSRAGPR